MRAPGAQLLRHGEQQRRGLVRAPAALECRGPARVVQGRPGPTLRAPENRTTTDKKMAAAEATQRAPPFRSAAAARESARSGGAGEHAETLSLQHCGRKTKRKKSLGLGVS